MKKLSTLISLLMLASMVLAACAPAATVVPTAESTKPPEATATSAPTAESTKPPEATATSAPTGLTCASPITIGLITDATGALASYGVMIIRSFMIGMEYAAGAPGSAGAVFKIENKENTFKIDNCEIKIIVMDDKSTPDTTASVANELINVDKVNILVGTASSAAAATLQGIALQNKIPLIVAPAAANDITGVNFNEYTFRTSRNNYQDAMNLCSYLPTVYKTFVQIAPDYAFGHGSADAFRDSCTLKGGKFVADDVFAPVTTTDFTPYMEPILKSGAESWIVTWAGAGFVAMMQAAKDQGVLDKMKLGSTFINNALMPTFFGNAIGVTSGILYHYTAPKNAINDFLVAKDTANYGQPPDLFDADGMNAALMAVAALKKTNGDTSSAALIKAMEGLEFQGPKGLVKIRAEDHVAIQDMYILTLKNVTDKDYKFYDYVTTTRPEPPCLLPEAMKTRCGDLPYGKLGQ